MRRRKKSTLPPQIFLLLGPLCACLIIYIMNLGGAFTKAETKAQQQITPTPQFAPVENNQPEATNSLEKAVKDNLIGTKGTYSVYIKNLKTGESYTLNEHRKYTAGSLYKLWIMGTTFDQISTGTLTKTSSLSANMATLNKEFGIASEEAEIKEGVLNMTVGSALQQMITISHNPSALLLTKKVKLTNAKAYVAKHGLKETVIGQSAPLTTAYDMGLFFEKLYKEQLATPEHTKDMFDLLKAQRLNNKLPQNMPKTVVIAHKTGELGLFSHDAGIVYSAKGDYIIVVMTETTLPKAANERIAEISKDVYEYFEKKN